MTFSEAERLFRQFGGQLRMGQALKAGVSRSVLYSMRDRGSIVPVSRGVYRLAELPAHREPDLCILSLRCPRAVICLVSALSFHGLTAQIPHEVHIARPQRRPMGNWQEKKQGVVGPAFCIPIVDETTVT